MRSAFLLLFAFLFVQFAAAQNEDIPDNPLFPKPRPKRFFVGPIFGYNKEFHSGGFRTLGGQGLSDVECGDFQDGGGNGIILGLTAEYWFKPGGPTALQMRAYYEEKPGFFTSTSTPLPLVDTVTNIIHYFQRTHEVTATYSLMNIEVTYKYNFPGSRFGVAAGPKFGFPMKSSYKQVQKVDPGFFFPDPNDTTARPSEQVLVNSPDEIPGVSGFRFGLLAHIQYEILMGPFLVTPRIFYDLGVTKVSGDWSVSSLAGTVEIKYGF